MPYKALPWFLKYSMSYFPASRAFPRSRQRYISRFDSDLNIKNSLKYFAHPYSKFLQRWQTANFDFDFRVAIVVLVSHEQHDSSLESVKNLWNSSTVEFWAWKYRRQ